MVIIALWSEEEFSIDQKVEDPKAHSLKTAEQGFYCQ